MTSKNINIQNEEYTLHINYQKNDVLRHEFNRLCREVWEFDFEGYYQSGYWGEDCILYSLFKGDQIVSHTTLSIFDLTKDGQTIKVGQLGTVMTEPTYQDKGLSRFLLEYIKAEYATILKGYFLFANDTVLEYYPKFGYTAIEEYQASISVDSTQKSHHSFEKLDLNQPESLALFKQYVEDGYTYNRLDTKNVGLAFFYCYATYDFSFRESVYYSKSLDAIAIFEQEEEEITIYAIYQKDHTQQQLSDIVNACAQNEAKTILFAFAPTLEGATYKLYKEDDDITLMVTDELISLLDDKQTMVTSLSHT
ncbi:MAG: GNAT family N-acetyltransferase [Flavobacteriaceae bacterium]|jgi:predicted acetyltransferase|nr:GNAT family N-acetyltransferase [Flavobacteriaceae bacterium]